MKCEHKSCGNKEKVWLPFTSREIEHGLKSHPYCVHCGAVKNISSDMPKRIGYYINIISHIRKNFRISDVQVRLIVNELITEDFEDPYWTTRSAQERMFLAALNKYCNLPENAVKPLLS
ncbi:MAG: hypothetical protein KKG76_07690 [Euryarchaeota archaeon]|nr:hypothetical protein [Euryarchaeota archaeon]